MSPNVKDWIDFFAYDPTGKQILNVISLSILLDCGVFLLKDKLFPIKERSAQNGK